MEVRERLEKYWKNGKRRSCEVRGRQREKAIVKAIERIVKISGRKVRG